MAEITDRTKEDLRFLTFPGTFGDDEFFIENDDIYNNYADKLETNKISLDDILIIREIFLKCGYNFKDNNDLEDFLITLFEAKNKGSLTVEVDNSIVNNSKYGNVFSSICLSDEHLKDNFSKTPVIYFDIKGVEYAGFQKYVKAALYLKKKLSDFISENKNNYEKINVEEIKESINEALEGIDKQPCPEQKVAIATSMVNKAFSVITGGPGTGKTTVVFSLISSLVNLSEKQGEKINPEDIVLLAPTGRASSRIKDQVKAQAEKKSSGFEFSRIENSTIHSFLKNISLEKNEKKENSKKFVIVDESSMVDIYLMAALFNRLDPKETRLVLVGDYKQLPSVDAGCVMADLSNYTNKDEAVIGYIKKVLGVDNIFETNQGNGEFPAKPKTFLSKLNWNHRVNDSSKVLNQAFKEIDEYKDGSIENIKQWTDKSYPETGAFYNNLQDNSEKVKYVSGFLSKAYFEKDEELGESYINYIKNILIEDIYNLDKDKIDIILKHLNKYKILTSMHGGLLGCDSINRRFMKEYREKIGDKRNICPGMGIMITKNNFRDNIYNGDVGVVLEGKISSGSEETHILYVVFKVKDEYRAFPLTSLENYDIAFAMTIHKSQGSEYENVLIPIEEFDENNDLLTKQLLYTAVTRAKNSFVLMGSMENIKKMCGKEVKRDNAIELF
ncbi:MAG: exodeoxyribonuclease V subunit alpha [Abditibacteriota bacterium]|nr:exodeoxyribonuclease V subunit alpha [Abditibacteriota bacterium]